MIKWNIICNKQNNRYSCSILDCRSSNWTLPHLSLFLHSPNYLYSHSHFPPKNHFRLIPLLR